MKKLTFFLLFLGAMAQSFAENRYWVAASSANWEDITSWSTSSGGASGAAVPTATDDVFIEAGIDITVTLGAAVSVNSITFTSRNVSFTGAFAVTTNSLNLSSSQITTVENLIINSELTFSGTDPRITNNASANGKSITLGNGGAFTLTGNSETNYFTGNTNAYYTYNTTSPLTVYFNPTPITAGGIVVTRGLITLGNNISTLRLNVSATNNQELIIGENTTLTLAGTTTTSNNFSLLSNAAGGSVNASAAGSKFAFKAKHSSALNATTKRIFKENSTINELQFNSSGYTLILQQPITVRTLTLTAGTIDNTSPNSITIAPSGSVVTGAGTTTSAVIYGVTTVMNAPGKQNAQIFVNAQNELVFNAAEKSNYAIYNAMGQLIENGVLIMEHETRNMKHKAAGVYLVKVNDKSTRIIIK